VGLLLGDLMFKHLTFLLAAFAVCGAVRVHGQKVTIINQFQGDTTGKGLDGFRLKGSTEHRVVIHYYEPADKGSLSRLQELVGASLNFYIDECAFLDGGVISFKKPRKEVLRDMNDIVKGAVKYYSYKEIDSFKGFSKSIEEQLRKMDGASFDASEYAAQVTDGASKKRLTYFFIQNTLNELKLAANLEVGNYSNDNLLVLTGSEEAIMDAATRDSLLQSMIYNPDEPLSIRNAPYSDATMQLLGMRDESQLPVAGGISGDFNTELMALLRLNTEQLKSMQEQMNQLRNEQLEWLESRQAERNQEFQAQIDDLRSMVIELVRFNTGSATASTGGGVSLPRLSSGTVNNVPPSVRLFFPRAITTLDATGLLTLNEVVDMLVRQPDVQVIITGYADRTGDARLNLELSRRRAMEVKRFFLKAGLDERRFVTRYLGDRDSADENAGDRKVTVEFVR
jgi:outer membrane protein OmpA-like peptidoglycan-associated protein